ncbi:hypothetical protein [Candidatus Contubernalis alkaliaceticus]|uniref:hypothetical protein n=1 Tax=Candidatus Contubernalis alkaliaceticus TaxID=338645 RepID=UPI001F4C1361|nr:hypothetical protein [Candidatus Contubernalis alkalaceticus]
MEDINRYKQWLAWVNNRLKALDEIENKLQQMRQLAVQVQEGLLNQQQIEDMNQKFKLLEQEVKQLDELSRNYILH